MEDRKLKEIEHSRKRREVLQGFERLADTHVSDQVDNLEELVKDKAKFDYYFANMKYYAITGLSEGYKHAWLDKECSKGKKISVGNLDTFRKENAITTNHQKTDRV